MTQDQITELRKIETEATPAPWFPVGGEKNMPPPDSYQWGGIDGPARTEVVTWGNDEGGFRHAKDGRLAVSMRNAFRRLLDEREALLAALKNVCEQMGRDFGERQSLAMDAAEAVIAKAES